ncbi:DEAD/DEAH box helicase family protein [uncultured Chryseobacterium sp.]|uniref:DEAD/DEAH box helicase family protein n=1 Tax=uncultured Chryseobacterium sp. TaxID=259322 RepID=UPI0025CBA313|nr:DEAD/DEAH box helicase family protein [uncultured Chryseobacterium sp.]
MSNFSNYPSQFESIISSAKEAEKYLFENLEVTGLYLRKALEQWVHFIYENEPSLRLPYDTSINSLMKDNAFVDVIDNPTLLNIMHAIRQLGNKAVHNTGRSKITESQAIHSLNLLHNISYYLMSLYDDVHLVKPKFEESLIPVSPSLQNKKQEELILKLQRELQEKAELEKQLLEVQKERESNRIETQKTILPPIDPDEAKTRELLIDYMLEEAGWDLSLANTKEFRVKGMPNNLEEGYADYVLWGNDGRPLAVVEAKRTARDHHSGRHQAELYAKCFEKEYGQLPNIFLTNGYEISFYDWNYPIRPVQGYYTRDELILNIQRRTSKHNLNDITIDEDITNRYYQIEAIKSVAERLEARHRGALLVMATGTGKTRTSAALIDVLSKANWAKKILFLADRTALVNQAKNNLNDYLPNLPSVNLVNEKEDTGSRIIFSTYQTLINIIDNEKTDNTKTYGIGHFDLIIFDEIHRSVYNKYKTIFNYFDGLKIGLTATPVDFSEKNTYELFGLTTGNPTYNYDLTKAISDQYLVPYKSFSVQTKFQRDGIKYTDLTEEEKQEYEEKFGDPITGEFPDEIESTALDQWIYNTDTADAILEYLMDNGIRVDNGNKLGKTIIFAKKHEHAEFLRKRFNANYPEFNDQFLKVIDYQTEYKHDLLSDFKIKHKNPQIACSVDMLDTGIDVPEVVNLVFLKPVKSRVKFWQMIGRGTRLCTNLFGYGDHKKDFLILDFCQNFEFFLENPKGADVTKQKSLGERLFTLRLKLSQILIEQDDELKELGSNIIVYLHQQVTNLYNEKKSSFIVRPHLRQIEKYQDIHEWLSITGVEYQDIINNIAHLVFEKEIDNSALSFDLMMLDFMISNLNGDRKQIFFITKMVNISNKLKKQSHISQINSKISTIKAISDESYWKDIDALQIEHLRVELRDLIKFLTEETRATIYTSLEDNISSVSESPEIYESKSFDKDAYRAKIEQFIKENQYNITIDKIRRNIKVTRDDLDYIENFLFEQGSVGSKEVFKEVFGERPLGEFIRSVVGLDKVEAKNAFSKMVNFASLNTQQVQFMDLIIEYFSVNGIMEVKQLFNPPFSDIYAGGMMNLFDTELSMKIANTVREINGNCVVA